MPWWYPAVSVENIKEAPMRGCSKSITNEENGKISTHLDAMREIHGLAGTPCDPGKTCPTNQMKKKEILNELSIHSWRYDWVSSFEGHSCEALSDTYSMLVNTTDAAPRIYDSLRHAPDMRNTATLPFPLSIQRMGRWLRPRCLQLGEMLSGIIFRSVPHDLEKLQQKRQEKNCMLALPEQDRKMKEGGTFCI